MLNKIKPKLVEPKNVVVAVKNKVWNNYITAKTMNNISFHSWVGTHEN